MRQRPDRRGGAGEDQHERDSSRAPQPMPVRSVPFISAAALLHSLAARASSASSLGCSAASTVSQPSPAASAAARADRGDRRSTLRVAVDQLGEPSRRRAANGSARSRPSAGRNVDVRRALCAIDRQCGVIVWRAFGAVAPVLAAQMQQLQSPARSSRAGARPRIAASRRCRSRRRAPPPRSLRRPHRTGSAAQLPAAARRHGGPHWRWSAAGRRNRADRALPRQPARSRTSGIATASSPSARARSTVALAPGSGRRTSDAPHSAPNSLRIDSGALRQQRARQLLRRFVVAAVEHRAVLDHLAAVLAEQLRRASAGRRPRARRRPRPANAQVAPSARVKARSAITQSISDLVVDGAQHALGPRVVGAALHADHRLARRGQHDLGRDRGAGV